MVEKSIKLSLLLMFTLFMCSQAFAQPIQPVSQRLETPISGDGAPGDNFGVAVAATGNRAVIGAYGDVVVAPGAATGIAQGSVYVYSHGVDGAWTMLQKITAAPFGEDTDNYGLAVAMDANLLIVGAPRRTANGEAAAGVIFIYAHSGGDYVLVQTLSASTPLADARFGQALGLRGDFLAVGIPGQGDGRVELYRRVAGQFVFERSLMATSSDPNARFGQALALSSTDLLIGAPQSSDGGAVYASRFQSNAWSNAVRLSLLPTSTTAELGASLALDANLALVGSPGVAGGQVRVLSHNGSLWNETGSLPLPTLPTSGRFGQALALNTDRAVVSATGAFGGDGAAYIFPRQQSAFGNAIAIDAADGGFADRFGAAVVNSDTGVLVGADLDTIYSNSGQGAVYAYEPTSPTSYLFRARIDSGDGAYLDRYGSAVAVDGNVAMIGAYLEDTVAGADAGAVHWFERSGDQWVRRGQILAPDAQVEDRFGIAVDIDGDRVAIGAFWDIVGSNVDQGSVYVFRRTGNSWALEAKLTAADGQARDLFGFALALEADTLVVGARGASVPFTAQGTAYVFRFNAGSWSQQARLDTPLLGANLFFGASVGVANGRALIGAPGQTVAGVAGAGAAYVYESSGGNWPLAGTLIATQPRENAAFGYSVSADSTRFLVGAFQDGAQGNAIGAGYLFRAVDRSLESTLLATQPQPGELMGISVAIDGESAVLGSAAYDLPGGSGEGAAHIFERVLGSWAETALLVAADADVGDNFGRAVAVDANVIVIGAPAKGRENPLEGAAYVYAKDGALFQSGFE